MTGFNASLISACIILLATFFSAVVVRAGPDICERLKEISSEDPAKSELNLVWSLEEVCRSIYWSRMRPLPLPKILNKAEIADYSRVISRGDCNSAAALLSNRFVAAHPHAPSIAGNKLNYENWKSRTVGKHFPRLGLCFNLEEIRIAQEEIDRLGLRAAPYAGYQKSLASDEGQKLPQPVRKRHFAIFTMHLRLGSSLSPAIAVALLKLSVEGKALKYHELNELYLAYRLRLKGQQDPIINMVIDRPLDVQQKTDIEERAKLGEFKSIPQYPD